METYSEIQRLSLRCITFRREPRRWLTYVLCLLSVTSPEAQAGEVKTLIFETGTVTLTHRDDVVDVNVTGLGCTANVSTTLNLTSVAESFTASHFQDEDLFYSDITFTGLENTITVQDFAAVKKSKLGRYKYLPFRLEDFRKILQLTSRVNMTKEAAKFKNLTVDVPFNASCPPILERITDLVWSSDEMTKMDVSLMLAILLEAVSYNRFIRSTDEYLICMLKVRYTDMPWVLAKCCGEATHDIYDSDTTREYVQCQKPDQQRQALSQLAMVIGSICFLFSPLLVRYVPEDPYQKKKEEEEARRKKRAAASTGSDLTVAEVEREGRVVEMKEIQSDANDAVADVRRAQIEADIGLPADDEDRVYLSGHPEYRLSLGTLLTYLVYLPPRHHARGILYRFAVMAAPRFLNSWLWVVADVYYESVLKENSALMSQGFMNHNFFRKIYSKEYQLMQSGQDTRTYYAELDRALIVYIPLTMTFVNMLLLYFLVVKPRDVCQTLVWTEEEHEKTKGKKWESFPKKRTSYPMQLYDNLKRRLSRLWSKSFWRRWWNDRVCGFSPLFRTGQSLTLGSRVDAVKQFVYVLVLFPVYVVYVFVHCVPCCAVFNNLYTEPRALLSIGSCFSNRKHVKFVFLVMALAMTAAGVILWYLVILELFWFGAYIIIFVPIDLLRNARNALSSVIFACSVVVYITKACKKFEETYRQLKLDLFTLVENYDGVYVLKSDGQTQLWTRNRSGRVSLPRCLFDEICQRYHPYRQEVFETLKRLLLTLFSLALLLAIVISFQAFEELSTTAEGLVMVATVSLPAVLGMDVSDTEKELRKGALLQGMQAIIDEMFELKEE